MPIILLLALINIVLIVHAAKRGRFSPWGFIILMVPGIGALAYVAMELIPEWIESHQGRQARKSIVRAIDPDRHYRVLKDWIGIADTIANRAALAEECLALGKYREAAEHYDAILAQPMGDAPAGVLGKARAVFGDRRFWETVALLDQLRLRWPDYESADGHLLYARALQECGRLAEAAEEYQAVSNYYVGAEPRVRHGLVLQKLGRKAEAREVLSDVVKRIELAPRHVRKTQAEWLAMARQALKVT
jgi:hypothetical protein